MSRAFTRENSYEISTSLISLSLMWMSSKQFCPLKDFQSDSEKLREILVEISTAYCACRTPTLDLTPVTGTSKGFIFQIRGQPFNSWRWGGGGNFWSSRISSNLVGRIFFLPSECSARYFFPPHFSAGFFFLKKGSCVYIYKMYLHLHCGHCSNSSNMELQSLKML